MTDRYLVVGDPVDHSLSPVIQQAAFGHFGIDAVYGRRNVDLDGLRTVVDEIRSGDLAGVNVTMPHKASAAGLADEVRGEGARVGAVNTLWAEDGQVIATSTDPEGVRHAWRAAHLPDGAPALVLGAGGAAGAALVALEGRSLHVAARRPAAAEALIARLAIDARPRPWGDPVPGCVVVNATPLGMAGERLPPAVIEAAAGLLEMTYGARPSPATTAMTDRGLPVATGELMLVGQGAASFAIWTGRAVPSGVMEAALATAQSGR